jgi:hypothetical protein
MVVAMAGLSKFVGADLSGSRVPAELHSILSQIKKPVLAAANPYALFPDLADQTSLIVVKGQESNLLCALEDQLSALERLQAERLMQLAQRYAEADKERLLKN